MIAVTQEQLEEQIALEREAIAQGLKRLRDSSEIATWLYLYINLWCSEY